MMDRSRNIRPASASSMTQGYAVAEPKREWHAKWGQKCFNGESLQVRKQVIQNRVAGK